MKKLFTLFMLGFSIASFAQVNVSFKIKAINADGIAVDTTEGVYIVGDVTNWAFRPMEDLGNHEYVFDTTLNPTDTLAYYFILINTWDSAGTGENWNYYKNFREYYDSTSIANCFSVARKYDDVVDRWILVPETDTTISASWGNLCNDEAEAPNNIQNTDHQFSLNIYPNPSNGKINVNFPSTSDLTTLEVYNITEKLIVRKSSYSNNVALDISDSPAGLYILKVTNGLGTVTSKILIR